MTKIIPILTLATLSLYAGKADVLKATYNCSKNMICSFNVSVKHADSGWKHYANKFDILSPSGKILGTRTLFHPHVNEQPFTRSLTDVKIPDGVTSVIIRAHDLIHGYGGKELQVNLR